MGNEILFSEIRFVIRYFPADILPVVVCFHIIVSDISCKILTLYDSYFL